LREPIEERRRATELVGKIFGTVMVVLYIALGTTIIFKAADIQMIPEGYAKAFGAVLILYGVYRAYKLYRRYYSSESES